MPMDMETEFQRHQHCKLRGYQLLAIQPEHTLRLLDEALEGLALNVVHLGAEQQTGAGAQLAVALVDQVGQDELLEVHVRLGDGDQVDARVQLVNTTHFSLDARRNNLIISFKNKYIKYSKSPPQLAQRELYGGELFTELVVQLLLKIRRTHIIDHGGHVRGEGEQSAMLAGN